MEQCNTKKEAEIIDQSQIGISVMIMGFFYYNI